jgi:predicted transposase YdaD
MPKQKPPRDIFPHQPHDRYARYALGIPNVASDLIRLSVPPAMFERIDISTLTLGHESFLDEQMVKHLADVCYTAQSKNGTPVRVNILFEHKSEQPDTAVYFQFLRYIVQIHSSELKQNRKASVVIPILLYHGAQPFKKERMEDLFTDYSEEFREAIPHYLYYVADMSHRSEDDYQVVICALTMLFVSALISGRNPNIAVDSWREVCKFAVKKRLTGVEMDFIQTTALYLRTISPEFNHLIFEPMVNENEVLTKDHLKEVFTAENFGRMLERIDNVDEIMAKGEKKGREEGREEGIALGIEKARTLTIGTFLLKTPDMPDEEVASLFDVTVEYVKDLREKMKAE